MGTQTASRMVSRARYEELLREELDKYNDKLGPHDKREIWFDALLCRRKVTAQMRWRVFKKLREMGFSFPAIGKVSGFNHSAVMYGLDVRMRKTKQKRYRMQRKQKAYKPIANASLPETVSQPLPPP